MKAVAKYIRISPRKANLVADLIRNKEVDEAMTLLKFLPKKAAQILYKILASARANAENNLKVDPKNLYIKQILVNKAPTLKRGMPVSRGRWHPIKKRNSHITIELAVKSQEKKKPVKKSKNTTKKQDAKQVKKGKTPKSAVKEAKKAKR